MKLRFSIDRGGTFTDFYAEILDKTNNNTTFKVLKVLSEDDSYPNAPREGIRRIMEEVLGIKIGINELIPTENIQWIRMGTTVATNALLERNSDHTNKKYTTNLPPPKRVALVTTKGFSDLLQIGNQTRPNIFDLRAKRPELLFDERFMFEVDERIRIRTDLTMETIKDQPNSDCIKQATNGEIFEIYKPFPSPGDSDYEE